MEIRQLRHFIAVVENGSLGRAAEVLGISEPALSKSIRTLEAHVGVQLLDRSPRGMRPTVYGTAMHRHARAVLSEVSSALGELRELRGVAKGVVRVGAQPSLAGMLLPGTIAALQALRPGVKVVAQVATTDLLTLLRDGDLDLILVTLAPALADASLEEEFLYDDEVVLVAGPGSCLAAAAAPTLDALLAARWVLPREPDPLRLLFEGAFARRGAGPPRVDIETGSETLIRACVERHGHASLLPRALVQDALDAGRMHQVALADFTLSRRIGVLRRRGTSLPPAAVALLEALRAESRRPRAHG
jgi:LysR family transcriptional regulator of gallate degradation